jgi:prephenate dehydrogenase
VDKSTVSLENANLVIVGLGLMGGSLALSLKNKCKHIAALDPDEEALSYALKKKIVHSASSEPKEILDDADIVILACPVRSIINWIRCLPDHIPHSCIVMDLGSTKVRIMEAFDDLPDNFHPVGGHPICGKEQLTIKNSDADIFRGANFVLVKANRSSTLAEKTAEDIAKAAGAKPNWLDAETHDRALASTSHLPYLIASTLAIDIKDKNLTLIGPGLRSTTRLAGTSTSMMLDVLATNSENLLNEIDMFKENLGKIEAALMEKDEGSLKNVLDSANSKYQSLIG